MGVRHDGHSMAPSLLPFTTPGGLPHPWPAFGLYPSCPNTDLGLGVLAPWEGREALRYSQYLYSVPALQNLQRHSTQGVGLAPPREVRSLFPISRRLCLRPTPSGQWLGSLQGHHLEPSIPGPPSNEQPPQPEHDS